MKWKCFIAPITREIIDYKGVVMQNKKIILLFILFAVSVSFAGCADKNLITHAGQTFTPTTMQTKLPTSFDEETTIQLPVDSVVGITESAAIALCYEILGEKAEETGYELAYRCVGAIEVKGVQYYVMDVTWLVDEKHWSYIGEVMVSADGCTIYDGDSKNGNYFLGEKRWHGAN